MPRKSDKLLRDIQAAAAEIVALAFGKTFAEYEKDRLLKLSIERLFMIVGEAVRRLREEDQAVFNRITNARRIVGFRNILVHDYGAVEDIDVWDTIQLDLPKLLVEVESLINSA